ncbi:MAG: hypothetical protein O3B43_04685 [Chloroflexi bacterium]|nr:hypothetical protein [Chloroflexota bacterium]
MSTNRTRLRFSESLWLKIFIGAHNIILPQLRQARLLLACS